MDYLCEQNANLVSELQELRQQQNAQQQQAQQAQQQQVQQPAGQDGGAGGGNESLAALRRELAQAELDRDAFGASLAAFGGGKDGAQRLAQFVTDKVDLAHFNPQFWLLRRSEFVVVRVLSP